MRGFDPKLALLAVVAFGSALCADRAAFAQEDFEVTLEVLDDISDIEGVMLILEEDRDDDSAEVDGDSEDRSVDASADSPESDEDIGDASEEELDDSADFGSDSDSLDPEEAEDEVAEEDTLSDSDLEAED